jgi:hypothetical protein
VISLAGGAGLYSLHAWVSSIQCMHFMSNVSEYTFSGRTSCRRRDGHESIPSECLKKIASIVDNAHLNKETVNDCDCHDSQSDDCPERGRSGSAALMDFVVNDGTLHTRGSPPSPTRSSSSDGCSTINLLSSLYSEGPSSIPTSALFLHSTTSDEMSGDDTKVEVASASTGENMTENESPHDLLKRYLLQYLNTDSERPRDFL